MRGNAFVFVAGILSSFLLFPAGARAQGKIRIAIWEFENHSDQRYWFSKDLGPAARNQIDTEFSENHLLAGKFSVVERDKLNLVLKEQGLAASGAVDPTTAAKVGRILGVKYVVLGGIDKFNIDVTNASLGVFGGVGGRMVQAFATINLRFVDTTTAERVLSVAAEGDVKSGGGSFRGNSLSRDAEWGIASDTIQKASRAVVEKLSSPEYLARVTSAATGSGVEGKIIKVEGDRAWINLGALAGIKVGDKFAVYTVGEALIDPDTGAKLGADERRTGNGAVVEVQSKFAVISFTGAAKAKDAIRKE
jgi:curli biogenesis system outer membrane secretion channel CsgG